MNFIYLFCRNSIINIFIITMILGVIDRKNLFLTLIISSIITTIEFFIKSNYFIEKFDFFKRIIFFLISIIIIEVSFFKSLNLLENKFLIIGILIYLIIFSIYIFSEKYKLKKEEEILNNKLEKYKEKFKSEGGVQVFNKIRSNKPAIRSILLLENGEQNENKYNSEAITFMNFEKEGIKIYNRNMITNKKGKLQKEFPFSDISLITITITDLYETRAATLVFPRYDYEGKEAEFAFRVGGRLVLEIESKNKEKEKIVVADIRKSFEYISKKLEDKNISFIDQWNLKKELKEKNDKEMAVYLKLFQWMDK